MSTKVDQASNPEPHTLNMSTATTTATTTPSSAVSNAGTKVSKFGAKAGFVIPKNKLSGSLVPVFPGGKKAGSNDAINEEEKVSKVQRKTKWGTDLTQDASVRRGRALAYQTRVDQIARQLESGSLEVEDNQGSEVAAQNADQKSPNLEVDGKKIELLQLEKLEVIGEILKLNPNYKAPPDYKPLLKEAIVPIPVKEYRGYNFLGLIFGPASDTQKRLEKETGTIIKVYGTKIDTGEKVEISTSDGNVQDAYEELYIIISADTYEKVDTAADLIELLVTSVSGSLAAISAPTLVSGANVNVISKSQGGGTPFIMPNAVVNQEVAQPLVVPIQTPPHGQFQDQIPWFPSGPPQNPMHHMNSSVPILTNPTNMPSLFGPRPGTAAGFPSILQTSSPVPPSSQPQAQVPPRSYVPQIHSDVLRNFPLPAPQPSSVQSNMGSLHLTAIQPQPTGPFAVGKPSMPLLPYSASSIPPRPLPDQPLTLANASASLGSSNMGQLIHGPRPVISQPGVACPAPQNISAANMVSPASFSSRASSSAMNPPPGPVFGSGPPPLVGSSPAFPALPPSQVPGSSPTPVPSTSRPTMLAGISGSVSGGVTNFSSINSSSAAAPRPQHPSSGDFTFQPHRPQNPAPVAVPRPSGMLTTLSPRPMAQLPAPQAAPQPIMQVPRPQFGNQIGQPHANTSAVLFGARNPNAAFANVSPVSPAAPPLQMGPRNFGPGPQPYAAGPFPPRPANPLPQNYPAPTNWLHRAVNQQIGNNRIGGPQIYDPFSPTVSMPPQQQGGANTARARKPENDPEYEDLMASVGVK